MMQTAAIAGLPTVATVSKPLSPVNFQDGDELGKIFVGALSWDTTHASLLKYFSRYGEVIDCVVMKNSATGKSRGFGFVKFKDSDVVESVLAAGPHVLDGRQIDPKSCNPRSMNKGGKNADKNKNKIFLGGLPSNITETEIRDAFSTYGKVIDVVIMFDQEKQKSRGFGFLSFEADESVDRVCSQQFIQIQGKKVECKRAEPRDSRMFNQFIAANGFMGGSLMPGVGLPGYQSGLTLLQSPLMPMPLTLTGMPGSSPVGLSAGAAAMATSFTGAAMSPSWVTTGAGSHGETEVMVSSSAQSSPFLSQATLASTGVSAGPGQILGAETSSADRQNVAVYMPYGNSPEAACSSPVKSSSAFLTVMQGYVGTHSPVPSAGQIPTSPEGAQTEKQSFLLYNGQSPSLGLMGSYPQEASGYGPARVFSATDGKSYALPGSPYSPAGLTLAASPSQLPALQGVSGMYGATAMTPGYGSLGALQVPLAYQPAHAAEMGTPGAYTPAMFPTRTLSAAQAFHPYRRDM